MKIHTSHSDTSHSTSFKGALAAISMAMLTLVGCGGGSDEPTAPHLSYAQRCQLPPTTDKGFNLPEPSGEHCIGKTRFKLVDASRPESLTPNDATDKREMSVKVWYPIAATPNNHRADYLDPAVLPYVKASLEIPDAAPNVIVNAVTDAALPSGQTYPVVIFSPGLGAVVEAYSSLLEDMASRGVIVVAIDHPYVSGVVQLASGEIATLSTPDDPDQFRAYAASLADVTVADERFVLDWLKGQDTGLLRGHLDLSRIGAYGHSLGGSAAIQVARLDDRVKAGMDIDGSVQGETASPWRKPVAFLMAANHPTDATIDKVLNAAAGSVTTVIVPDTKHLDFSDLKMLLEFYVPDRNAAVWKQSDLGTASALSVLKTSREQVWSFFRQHVL